MSNRAKICPNCRRQYPENAEYCEPCGLDIGRVEPVEPPGESPPSALPLPTEIVCPKCGENNPALKVLCSRCTEPLPRAEAQQKVAGVGGAPSAGAATRLEMVIGRQTYECKDGDVIGREGTIANQAFGGDQTVSRQHLKVLLRNDRWCIIMLSDQTSTNLDGRPLSKGQLEFLTGEHRVRLSSSGEITLRVPITRS